MALNKIFAIVFVLLVVGEMIFLLIANRFTFGINKTVGWQWDFANELAPFLLCNLLIASIFTFGFWIIRKL